MKRLIIVGGLGSGVNAMTVFEDVNSVTNEWIIEGFINDLSPVGSNLGKYPIVGNTEQLLDFVNRGYYIHYTYHFNAKMKHQRVIEFKKLNIPLEAHASAIHPLAYVNPSSYIGFGTVLFPFASTSSNVVVGNFNHIYTNGFVGHDSETSDFCTLAAHSIIGARIKLQEGAHVGLNSCIREDINIGKYSVIGMGSVVVKDVDDYAVVVGNPAKKINTIL